MMTEQSKVRTRRGAPKDAAGVVALFEAGGNPHAWSIAKWNHYYRDYPEGAPVFFVAEADGAIIGHYGLLPVRVGGHDAYMGVHAYVSEKMRGLAVISLLMKSVDDFCRDNGVPFVVGFANPRFTQVKTRLFRWKTLLWAPFVEVKSIDLAVYAQRPFCFDYSKQWREWRFGVKKDVILSRYRKADGSDTVQLLHGAGFVEGSNYGIARFECWDPGRYSKEESTGGFAQPFSMKLYDRDWGGQDLFDPANWFIQMGDSDTFVYAAL